MKYFIFLSMALLTVSLFADDYVVRNGQAFRERQMSRADLAARLADLRVQVRAVMDQVAVTTTTLQVVLDSAQAEITAVEAAIAQLP